MDWAVNRGMDDWKHEFMSGWRRAGQTDGWIDGYKLCFPERFWWPLHVKMPHISQRLLSQLLSLVFSAAAQKCGTWQILSPISAFLCFASDWGVAPPVDFQFPRQAIKNRKSKCSAVTERLAQASLPRKLEAGDFKIIRLSVPQPVPRVCSSEVCKSCEN